MARKRKVNFNIDKLKLCYKYDKELFQELQKHEENTSIQFDCFYLIIRANDKDQESKEDATRIVAQVILDDNTELGVFTFNGTRQFENLCFFEFSNKIFYTKTIILNGTKCNELNYLDYVADTLNLTLNNVTQLDIAADVNFNMIKTIRSLIKNYNEYDFIYNGKRIEDENRIIENYSEQFARSRAKLQRTPTLYFRQAKDEGLRLKVYNKTEEIKTASAHKEYINQWNEFGWCNTYRLEISIRNEDFKKFCAYLASDEIGKPQWAQLECLLSLLQDERYKSLLWEWGTLRMAYFRPKKRNAAPITLFDLIDGDAAL